METEGEKKKMGILLAIEFDVNQDIATRKSRGRLESR